MLKVIGFVLRVIPMVVVTHALDHGVPETSFLVALAVGLLFSITVNVIYLIGHNEGLHALD